MSTTATIVVAVLVIGAVVCAAVFYSPLAGAFLDWRGARERRKKLGY